MSSSSFNKDEEEDTIEVVLHPKVLISSWLALALKLFWHYHIYYLFIYSFQSLGRYSPSYHNKHGLAINLNKNERVNLLIFYQMTKKKGRLWSLTTLHAINPNSC